MPYVPQNPLVFAAAFAGAIAGIGSAGKNITSTNPLTYTEQINVADAFAQSFDSGWGSDPAGSYEIQAVLAAVAGHWSDRGTTNQAAFLVPATWDDESDAIITLIQGGGAVSGVKIAAPSGSIQVRYVMTDDVPDLGAFTVLQDGVTGIAGDYVLLAAQTTASESAIYKIGTVAAGVAPITRVQELQAGAKVKDGYSCTVGEGDNFANTVWFIPTNGTITIGTTGHLWFPEQVTIQLPALVAGTLAAPVSSIPLLSATKSAIIYEPTNTVNAVKDPADWLAMTIKYATFPVPTAGVAGAASIQVQAQAAAGGILDTDISVLKMTVINR